MRSQGVPCANQLKLTLPGFDGSTRILPRREDASELGTEDLVMGVAKTVGELMLQKLSFTSSQQQFQDMMETLVQSPWVKTEFADFITQNCATYEKSKRFLEKLGASIPVVEYHLCGNAHCSHVYRRDSAGDKQCPNPKCKAPRFREVDGKPHRKMYYLPVEDWLCRLREVEHLKKLMEWWIEERKPLDGYQTDVYDSAVWKLLENDENLGDKRESSLHFAVHL